MLRLELLPKTPDETGVGCYYIDAGWTDHALAKRWQAWEKSPPRDLFLFIGAVPNSCVAGLEEDVFWQLDNNEAYCLHVPTIVQRLERIYQICKVTSLSGFIVDRPERHYHFGGTDYSAPFAGFGQLIMAAKPFWEDRRVKGLGLRSQNLLLGEKHKQNLRFDYCWETVQALELEPAMKFIEFIPQPERERLNKAEILSQYPLTEFCTSQG